MLDIYFKSPCNYLSKCLNYPNLTKIGFWWGYGEDYINEEKLISFCDTRTVSGGELCTTCQSLLFLTWTSCLWLSRRNVFTCRTGLCFSFGRGLSLPTLGVFTFIQYLLARFWIRADLINSSFPLPFPSGDAPVALGCSLLSAQSPALLSAPSRLSRPFPGDVCGSEGLEFPNSCSSGAGRSLSVSTKPLASYHTMTCWVFLK